jgi:hypothetical protein
MKRVVQEFGIPTISNLGSKPSFHAWKLVQHSEDTNFQKEYLKLMEENINDVNKRDYAYLKDRVLLACHEQQIYGTQFIKTANGEYEPTNLDDPTNVDARRKSMDLDTLEENITRIKNLYGK